MSAYKSSAFKMPARRALPMRTGGFVNPTRPNQAELKFKDTTTSVTMGIASGAFSTPGATTLLNGLAPDSTASGRIGRRINMKSLYIRGTAQLAAASTVGGPVRMIVIYDKQSNATAPAVTDILVADSFIAPNNISNRDRFVTLVDQVVGPISTAGNQQVAFTCYKKLSHAVQYNAGVAGTIGDITSGAIYILFAQGGSIATAAPVAGFYARIRYEDF